MTATPAADKPLILIVHGAWHVPLHFRRFITLLRARGYRVPAPALRTSSVDDDAAGKTLEDDVAVLRGVLGPWLDRGERAIVLGHSYGGIPGTEAARGMTVGERNARGEVGGVVGIVYLAAYVLASEARGERERFGPMDVPTIPMPQDMAALALYHDVDPPVRSEALAMLVSMSAASVDPDSTPPADVEVPKTYVVCLDDRITSVETQRGQAELASAEVVELECSHSPFLKEEECGRIIDIFDRVAIACA